jgi:hypothetical protein
LMESLSLLLIHIRSLKGIFQCSCENYENIPFHSFICTSSDMRVTFLFSSAWNWFHPLLVQNKLNVLSSTFYSFFWVQFHVLFYIYGSLNPIFVFFIQFHNCSMCIV